MKKLRASSIRDIVNSVRHVISSNKRVLTKVVHNFPLQEHWITRILASGFDYILMFFVTGFAKDLLFPNLSFSLINYILMMGAMSVVYSIITESIFGYTLGKRLFDLKVVKVNGDKPSFKEVFVRNSSKIFFIFLILDIIGSSFIANNLHQRYLDKIAHTTVETGKMF